MWQWSEEIFIEFLIIEGDMIHDILMQEVDF